MSEKLEMPEIPREFIVRLSHAGNKEYIKAEGLIYLGHLQGLKRIDVRVVQFPTPESPGTCYARCEVETAAGVFADYGEVTPSNRGQVGGQYPVSLACTRARNRALRQATNCPLTSYEEMGMAPERDEPGDETTPEEPPRTARRSAPQQGTPPDAPATRDQRERLAKLLRAVGRPAEVPADLQAGVAAHLIADLAAELNSRAVGPAKR